MNQISDSSEEYKGINNTLTSSSSTVVSISENSFNNATINYSILMESTTNIFDQAGTSSFETTSPAVGSLIWHQEKRKAHFQRSQTSDSTTSLESYSISCSSKSNVCDNKLDEEKAISTSLKIIQKKDYTIPLNKNNLSCNNGPSTSREHYCIHHHSHLQTKFKQYQISSNSLIDNNNINCPENSTTVVNTQEQNFYYPSAQTTNSSFNNNNNNSLNIRNNTSALLNNNLTFCFGLLMVRSTFITFFIFDIILLSHSIVFTVTNYLNGAQRYENLNSNSVENLFLKKAFIEGLTIATSLIPYNFLLPLFALQTVVSTVTSSDVAVVTNNNTNTYASDLPHNEKLNSKKQADCLTIFQDQKLGSGLTKQQLTDYCIDCCYYDETYSTKSTIIITD